MLQKWNGAKSGTVKRVLIRAAQFVQDENHSVIKKVIALYEFFDKMCYT